jgi:hypothetical protein
MARIANKSDEIDSNASSSTVKLGHGFNSTGVQTLCIMIHWEK